MRSHGYADAESHGDAKVAPNPGASSIALISTIKSGVDNQKTVKKVLTFLGAPDYNRCPGYKVYLCNIKKSAKTTPNEKTN